MNNYLFIESRGLFESGTASSFFTLARDVALQGGTVEIFLVQNGVLSARSGARADGLMAALHGGINVLADDFSLKERALSREQLARGVKTAPIGVVIDRMAEGWKVLWH